MTKILLDGTLFSECEIMGSNRNGMQRVAEGITRELLAVNDVEISFANTITSDQYDSLLRKYVKQNYPSYKPNIISYRPVFVPEKRRISSSFNRLYNSFVLPAFTSRVNKRDIFHSFYYPFPEYLRGKKIKKTITFLDIIPLRRPGYTPDQVRTTKSVIESIVPNFGLAISEFSKQDLVEYDKRIDPDRVFVVPLAASSKMFFRNMDQENWERVKKKYGLPDNYFLTVSSTDVRKNVPHLIKTFSKYILQERPKDLFLVVTGNSTYTHSILETLEIPKIVRERVIITDRFVENEDLSVIYSHTLCFFFMSYYEGFGLPILEAMQCGAPVVTSNRTSIPEIVDGAGIMLSPDDEDALAEAMNAIFLNRSLRDEYSKLAVIRSKQFTWQRSANEYASIFKKISTEF